MKHKAVHADNLVTRHAHLIDQAFHIPQTTKSGHEVTVTISTLTYITCCGTINIELRLLEDVLSGINTVLAKIQ